MRFQIICFLCFCVFSYIMHGRMTDEKIEEAKAQCGGEISAKMLLSMSLKALGEIEVRG